MQWDIIQPSKGRKSCHIYNMDKSQGYYAKLSRPATKE